MSQHKNSIIESLPLDIVLLLFTTLSGTDRLLLALASPLLWSTYNGTRPYIPSLWTLCHLSPAISSISNIDYDFPENYPKTTETMRPLGCLLQRWMSPKYRMIRFSKQQGKDVSNFEREIESQLPPFFVRVSWRDSKYWFHRNESSVFRRYAIYHACRRYADEETRTTNDPTKIEEGSGRRRDVLPHPRGMSDYKWSFAVKRAIEDDRYRWRTRDEWEQWWLNYQWWGLESCAKNYAEELVKDGLGIPNPNHNLG